MDAVVAVVGRLTQVDADHLDTWLERAQRELESEGANVRVADTQLEATLDLFGVSTAVRLAVADDRVEVTLRAPVPEKRAVGYVRWLCDLLELTPEGTAVAAR